MAMLHGTLVDRVAKIITRYNMLPGGGRVGVAVSGGADSVVLLHVLAQLAPKFAAKLAVLHANHELRGTESEQDAEFVSQLAARLGLPYRVERLPVSSKGNLEENARDLRRDFFCRIRCDLHLDAVAVGHTRSDQAETVLFRFLRGSGTAGVAGMRFVTPDRLIRPLLELSRDEVRAWAAEQALTWRDDSSNADLRFVRNRLRLETIPLLTSLYNPNLEGVLASVAEAAQDEDDFWSSEAEKALSGLSRRTRWGLAVDVEQLSALPRALMRRVVRLAVAGIKKDGNPPDLQHVRAICELCATTDGHDRVMAAGADVMRSFGTLMFAEPGQLSEPRHYRAELEPGKIVDLPFGGGTVCLEELDRQASFYATVKGNPQLAVESFALSRGALTAGGSVRPLFVRNWLPGDMLVRPGHQSPDKLKSLFQQHRVLLWERKHWPVLVAGHELLWARRFGCAATIAQETAAPAFRFTFAMPE